MRTIIQSVENILTSPGFPVVTDRHNSFPDAMIFKGKEYVVFRSAKHHFPTSSSRIIILSKNKKDTWQLEHEFHLPKTDVRDPRFLIANNRLYLYFGTTKANKYTFIPLSIYQSSTTGDGIWQPPIPVYKPGYIISRVRRIGGKYLMCVYKWSTKKPWYSKCRIIASQDGRAWNNRSTYGQLQEEGVESDCIPLSDNRLLWIIRNDYGIRNPAGSVLTVIDAQGQTIRKRFDKRKFDAPLLIPINKKVYLVSRSQKAFKGNYNVGTKFLPKLLKTGIYLSLYWLTPKTTSLWEIDPTTLDVNKVTDLPSQGDTGYCSSVETGNKEMVIYNYSSNIEGKKMSWRKGQSRPTSIYRYTVEFS